MPPRRILPALLLALALTGCGDDEEPATADSVPTVAEAVADRANALLACTTEEGLTGTIGMAEGGVLAVDLTTEDQTIVVHLLASEAAAAAHQNSADLDQEQVGNAVILGGAISPENRAIIKQCLQDS